MTEAKQDCCGSTQNAESKINCCGFEKMMQKFCEEKKGSCCDSATKSHSSCCGTEEKSGRE